MREAVSSLDDLCSDPSFVGKIINLCLEFEEEGDVEKALAVIEKLCENHPTNEQARFTHVRMSGYDPKIVKEYLELFAYVGGGDKPYAVDFLDNVLDSRYTHLVNLLLKYAENKTSGKTRKKYIDILEVMRQEYTTGTNANEDGMKLIYAFYSISSAINVGLVILCIALAMNIAIGILIVMAVFCAEFFVMYLHGKMYGHRLTICQTERMFMMVFLCSIPFAIGGALIGGIL